MFSYVEYHFTIFLQLIIIILYFLTEEKTKGKRLNDS